MKIHAKSLLLIGAVGLVAGCSVVAAEKAVPLPDPVADVARPLQAGSKQTAVFAGGCFWGVQGVFQHVKGVGMAVSGYAGGKVKNPAYEQVSGGDTGHPNRWK